jgi:Holliday junction resolvase RusA-like endonuclease
MTSEKMNHIMPMRNERSTAMLYMPCSFSPMTVPNQNTNMEMRSRNPGIRDQAGSQAFRVQAAPIMRMNSDTDP